MLTQDQVKKITRQNRINKLQYLGILSDYQTISKDLVQTVVYSELNQHQHFLFKRVLHGLNVYDQEEVTKMRMIARIDKIVTLSITVSKPCNYLAHPSEDFKMEWCFRQGDSTLNDCYIYRQLENFLSKVKIT